MNISFRSHWNYLIITINKNFALRPTLKHPARRASLNSPEGEQETLCRNGLLSRRSPSFWTSLSSQTGWGSASITFLTRWRSKSSLEYENQYCVRSRIELGFETVSKQRLVHTHYDDFCRVLSFKKGSAGRVLWKREPRGTQKWSIKLDTFRLHFSYVNRTAEKQHSGGS